MVGLRQDAIPFPRHQSRSNRPVPRISTWRTKFKVTRLVAGDTFANTFLARSLLHALLLATALLALCAALTFGLAIGVTAVGRWVLETKAHPGKLTTPLVRATAVGSAVLATAAFFLAVAIGWRAEWRRACAAERPGRARRARNLRWLRWVPFFVAVAAWFAGA
ncbi:uncharacterized protein BXZ73DRAFT_83701, partial [Epithele typhae]|uniref:uncharacterized protein n=1 Tax=Epithele typhae TaxID=378194 RepID=UPI0020085CCF